MPFPERSDFTSATANAAWWRQLNNNLVCAGVGVGLIAAAQVTLRNALRAPWTSYDGAHTTRPDVDGNWGPVMNAALWTYAGLIGATTDRGIFLLNRDTKMISPASVRMMIWAAFYQPRKIDLDAGGVRLTTPQLAILGTLPLDRIQLPDDVITPRWLQRPNVPGDLAALGAALPSCAPEVAGGTLGGGPGVPEVIPAKLPTRTTTTTTPGTTTIVTTTPATPPAQGGSSVWAWVLGAGAVIGGVALVTSKGSSRGGGGRRKRRRRR